MASHCETQTRASIADRLVIVQITMSRRRNHFHRLTGLVATAALLLSLAAAQIQVRRCHDLRLERRLLR